MPLIPRPVPTVAALIVIATTIRLGVWQVHRYYETQIRAESIRGAYQLPPLETLVEHTTDLDNRRAHLRGSFLDAPPALSAGGLVGGLPGYRLVRPFQLMDGPSILVDQGWVPVDSPAASLSEPLPDTVVTLDGLLIGAHGNTDLLPHHVAGIERWPLDGDLLWGILPRVLGPPYGAIAVARGVDIPIVLRAGEALEEERLHPGPLPVTGYVLPLPKIHHRSYAAQWFAIAGGTGLLWLWGSWVRVPAVRED